VKVPARKAAPRGSSRATACSARRAGWPLPLSRVAFCADPHQRRDFAVDRRAASYGFPISPLAFILVALACMLQFELSDWLTYRRDCSASLLGFSLPEALRRGATQSLQHNIQRI
jgi:hypothetical protein